MVSVVHSVASQSDFEHSLQTLSEGLSVEETEKIRQAAEFLRAVYADRLLGSGEGVWQHALGMALILGGLKLDADTRLAALLFSLPAYDEQALVKIEERFSIPAARLVSGITRLNTRSSSRHSSRQIISVKLWIKHGDCSIRCMPSRP